jgi:predicted SnoaL-like aldol condensation-catalyzing enzyme
MPAVRIFIVKIALSCYLQQKKSLEISNKKKAISFLKLAGLGQVREAYEKYVAPAFVHHNQYFKGDRASLLNAMEEAHQTEPNSDVTIKYAYEDGDTVITHSLVTKERMKIAVVHIFRFEEGMIVELWDLGQEIDEDSPNENGLF